MSSLTYRVSNCTMKCKKDKNKEDDRMDGTRRCNIHKGALVDIVLKKDQGTTKLTRGHVKDILTNSSVHHRGIKVRIEDGNQVGRVQTVLES